MGGFPFHSVMVFAKKHTLLILMEFNLSFIVYTFYIPSKKYLPNVKAQRYPPVFSSEANNLNKEADMESCQSINYCYEKSK